jgi:hypothetical protein
VSERKKKMGEALLLFASADTMQRKRENKKVPKNRYRKRELLFPKQILSNVENSLTVYLLLWGPILIWAAIDSLVGSMPQRAYRL